MLERLSIIIDHIIFWTYLFIIVTSIITVLTDGRRNPVRTISWILVISLLPYVGIFFYLVFGRSYHRQKRISNRIKKKISNISKKQAINQVDLNKYPIVEKNIKLATLIGKTSELGVYGNNEIDIFTNGVKLLDRMLEDISKAKDHIHAEYFIIETDETGKKYKESPEVLHAVEAHHNDVEPQTIIAVLVQAADAISAARPGARREDMENYIKRLQKLEEIAASFQGVDKAFAIQAGREIRVMVKPELVNDDGMKLIAREMAKKIEDEVKYPGQIKLNLIRETRTVDYAK